MIRQFSSILISRTGGRFKKFGGPIVILHKNLFNKEGFAFILLSSKPNIGGGRVPPALTFKNQKSQKPEDYFQENSLGYWKNRKRFGLEFYVGHSNYRIHSRCPLTTITNSDPANVTFRKPWSFFWIFCPAIISCFQFEFMMTFSIFATKGDIYAAVFVRGFVFWGQFQQNNIHSLRNI